MQDKGEKGNISPFWEELLIGLLLIGAGLFTLFNTRLALSSLPTILGLAAILLGSIHAGVSIQGLVTGSRQHASSLGKAVLPLVAGLLFLIRPAETMDYLVMAIGLYLIVNAVFMSVMIMVMGLGRKFFFWTSFVIVLLVLMAGLLIVLAPSSFGVPVELVIGAGLFLTGLLYLLRAAGGKAGKGKHKEEPPPGFEADEIPQ